MLKIQIQLIAVLVVLLCAKMVFAITYQVGPTRTYTSLQEVTSLLNPGDTVEVDGDTTYPGGVAFSREGSPTAKIHIKGIKVNGNRPIISGGTNTVAFQTPSPYSGPGADHYIFEGFEVTGGTSRGIYHQADDLTIRDVIVRDCPAQGILGADQGSGSLTMEYVEVYGCGSGSYRHQIYMATDEVNRPGSVFRMQFCYIHDGNGGNNVKTRAERNEIYYNWIENAYYHELEMIGADGGDGGNPGLVREDSDVVGNVLRKTSRNGFVTRVGGDGTGETNGRYRFVNNTIIGLSSAVFRLFDGIESIEMHNNVFISTIGGGVNLLRTTDADWTTGSALIAGSNNWFHEDSTNVPTEWTASITGINPGFVNINDGDLRPTEGSPLVNQAASSSSGTGHSIPSPLSMPAMHPPQHVFMTADSAVARTNDGSPDIGAFEVVTDTPPDDDPDDSDSDNDDPNDDSDNSGPENNNDSQENSGGSSGGGCFLDSTF